VNAKKVHAIGELQTTFCLIKRPPEKQMFTRFTGPLILLLTITLNAQNKAPTASHELHGTYEELSPVQKKLLDEWYAEYNQMTHDNSQPTEYNQFSLSTRSTFEAVTHALMTTELTEKSGKSMGNALDLVRSIEAINGKVPRARGDLQFRVYVVLKPDALQKLKASREFFRDRDNTVYHHGYPLNYRQDGGTPSIQVSIAKDARHADIDVDYRSAKFPEALLNGHLTAANSDVRAGGNTQKHLQRWQGLTDWWKSLFGFPEEVEASENGTPEGEIPSIPRKGDEKVEAAAADYLTAWLVEQKPNLSAAYLSSLSYSCLEEYGPNSGKIVSAGVAPYLATNQMAAVNKAIGKVNTLQDAVEPISLRGQNLKALKHSYRTAFSLYQVSNGLAAEFLCDPERAFEDFGKRRAQGSTRKYGSYVASAFRLKGPKGKSDAITLLWRKEAKYWKVIAWDVEPEEVTPGKLPDIRRRRAAAKTAPAETQISADREFVHASRDFLHSWLVADNFDHASAYFSQRSDKCVLAYLPADKPAPSTPADYAAYVRSAMTSVGKDVGPVQHLRDAIEPVQPEHDDLKILPHEGEGAYTVAAVPDYLTEMFLCDQESSNHPYDVTPDPKGKIYGNYYAILFNLRTPGEHPAVLTLLWAKDSEKWKIIAYELLAP
jgi:hypothetical protein